MSGMNMPQSFGAMDVIVLAVLVFTVVFVIAWLVSPALRAWIERPKYRFMRNVEAHDRQLNQRA
jgi:hypothetical protein